MIHGTVVQSINVRLLNLKMVHIMEAYMLILAGMQNSCIYKGRRVFCEKKFKENNYDYEYYVSMSICFCIKYLC